MAAAEAGKAGLRAILLEQHFPGTQEGSSAEHVRMWRTMYTEKSHAVLAYKSGDMFGDIERQTGRKILHRYGLLNFGIETDYSAEGTLLSAAKTLTELGKSVRMLSSKDIEREYPFRNLPDNYVGVFQEDNAVIDVGAAISAAAEMAPHDIAFYLRDVAAALHRVLPGAMWRAPVGPSSTTGADPQSSTESSASRAAQIAAMLPEGMRTAIADHIVVL